MYQSFYGQLPYQGQNHYLQSYRDAPSMTKILDASDGQGSLYLGDIDAASDYETLRSHKIGAVLTVAARTGLEYNESIIPYHLVIQSDDHPSQDLSQYFDQMYNFIEKGRNNTNILVHCFAGVSRSVTAVIMYLMRKYNWSYDKAYYQCKSKRSIINPNPGFVKQLKQLENNQQRKQYEPVREDRPQVYQSRQRRPQTVNRSQEPQQREEGFFESLFGTPKPQEKMTQSRILQQPTQYPQPPFYGSQYIPRSNSNFNVRYGNSSLYHPYSQFYPQYSYPQNMYQSTLYY